MSWEYIIDAREWPVALSVRLGSGEDITWLPLGKASGDLAVSVIVDFDDAQRACGVEIAKRSLIASWDPSDKALADGERVSTGDGLLLLPSASAEDQEQVRAWARAITSHAGGDDPRLSLHWQSRRAYAYSAEIEELAEDGVEWVELGINAEGLLVGLRVVDPREHLRGVQR